ncbi:hypothetical protein D3D02_17935, partial [Halobellus sp. Atlit-38R]
MLGDYGEMSWFSSFVPASSELMQTTQIASMVDGAIGTMMWAAEQYYSIDRHVDVAIDITYIAYYGDRDEFQMST